MTQNKITLGNATLYNGDCMDGLGLASREWALISDPPYGINIAKMTGKSRNRWNVARRTVQYDMSIIGDDEPFDPSPFLGFKTVVMFGANHFGSRLPDASCWFVWDKRDGSTSDHQADCELAWTNLRGPARLFSHKWRGMVRAGEENVARGGIRVHPTQKPVALMCWAIVQCKLPPDTVIFDPFMGSGTTGVAAVRLGYRFVGYEIDSNHFSHARSRIEAEQRQLSLIA